MGVVTASEVGTPAEKLRTEPRWSDNVRDGGNYKAMTRSRMFFYYRRALCARKNTMPRLLTVHPNERVAVWGEGGNKNQYRDLRSGERAHGPSYVDS